MDQDHFEHILEAATIKKNVIENVHICGLKSANGRSYAPAGLKTAISLYENSDVYLNHSKVRPRPLEEKIGYLTGVNFKEGSGLWGNLHLNEAHPTYAQVAWFAEHAPKKIGLSHDVDGEYNKTTKIIESITVVNSVDLVSKPATVAGLTEAVVADKVAERLAKNRLDTLVSVVNSLSYDVLWPTAITEDEKVEKLILIYKDAISQLKSTTAKEEVMDWTKVTLEDVRKNAPNIVEAIEAPLKAAQATAITEATAKAVAEEKTFQEAFTKLPEKARTAIFEKQLRAAAKAGTEEVKSLVEAFTELASGQKAISAPTTGTKQITESTDKKKVNLAASVDAALGIKE